MIIQWTDEDNCFLVLLPDFPDSYWHSRGDTYDEAVANGNEPLKSLIVSYKSTCESLPKPKLISASI